MGIESMTRVDPRTKQKKIVFRMRVRVRLPNGEIFQRSSYHDTQREAKIAEGMALEEIDSKDKIVEFVEIMQQIRLRDLLLSYKEKVSVKKAPSTHANEKFILEKTIPGTVIDFIAIDQAEGKATRFHPLDLANKKLDWKRVVFGRVPIGEVKKQHLIYYIRARRALKIADETIKKEIQLISSAYKALPELFPHLSQIKNPRELLSKAEMPKTGKPRERVPTDRERDKIFEFAGKLKNKEMLAIIRLEIATAMRRGEVLSLEWDRIDEKKRLAFLPNTKTGRGRWVPLTEEAIEAINSIPTARDKDGKLFHLTSYGVATNWKRLLRRAGLHGKDLRMHDLRHAALTDWAALGLNTAQAAALAGNADLRNFEHRHGPKMAAFAMARKIEQGEALSTKDTMMVGGHETMRQHGRYINLSSSKVAEAVNRKGKKK